MAVGWPVFFGLLSAQSVHCLALARNRSRALENRLFDLLDSAPATDECGREKALRSSRRRRAKLKDAVQKAAQNDALPA
jgi:hypothetical protein